MGVDYCGDVVLLCDLPDKVVDNNRSVWIESGVGFVTKEIFGV